MATLKSGWFDHPRFASAVAGTNVIKAGDTGPAVRTVQQALIKLGYSFPLSTKKSGELDGVFGNETHQRVLEFQKVALPNESPDGKIGPKTLSAMDERLTKSPPPKSSDDTWGEAPPIVPGSPQEIDLGTFYGGLVAEQQPHDMACWATCLSFWAKFCRGGRPRLKPGKAIALYNHLQKAEGPLLGGMPTGALKQILLDQATPENVTGPEDENMKWNAFVWDPFNIERFTYDWLQQNTGSQRAIYLGYTIDGKSHINVVWHYDLDGSPQVGVMEPMDGRFKIRHIEYYQQSTRSFFAIPK
jgi:hypothetical protein